MAKFKLNWKAPSDKQMKELVKELDDNKKKSFAEACIEVKDGKNKINRANAKKWLVAEFDGTDHIEWIGRPEPKEKKLSSVDEIAGWLNL